jgi:hypothetical protein
MKREYFINFSFAVVLIITFAAALSPSIVLARLGSNLGDYGTNFSPAVLTGQVTDAGGNAVSGALVSTVAGHSTASDTSGNYTLSLDAPGIYTVTATKDTGSATGQPEVSLGSITTLNHQLGTSCTEGDANGDHAVNILDAIKILRMVLGQEQPPQDLCPVDIDKNNSVDIIDLTRILSLAL